MAIVAFVMINESSESESQEGSAHYERAWVKVCVYEEI